MPRNVPCDKIAIGKTYLCKWNEWDPYVWNDYIPVRIDSEHKYFFVGTVLEHRNIHGYGPSKPYRVTLNKLDVKIGSVVVRNAKR